ncbi:hypothetical protein AB0K92_03140 [Streptomyces sp. NPDC052687]|uniref:hypothetical protein n=1 Tax=Streptomyces sp. NPDC052687 TaxID=3154759 RepID=UPI003416892E
MPGRPIAHPGRPSTRCARALAAAVLAVTALVAAANTGPARATEPACGTAAERTAASAR